MTLTLLTRLLIDTFKYLLQNSNGTFQKGNKSFGSPENLKPYHPVMNDGAMIAFTFCRESLESGVCTEREIKPT